MSELPLADDLDCLNSYTVKKVSNFPHPSRDANNQTLPGRDIPAEEGKSKTFFTVYWRMSLILSLPLADEFDCLNSHWLMRNCLFADDCSASYSRVVSWLSRYTPGSGFGLSLSSPSSPMSTPSSHITGIPDFLHKITMLFSSCFKMKEVGG